MKRMLFILPVLFILAGCGDDQTVPAGSGMIEATEIMVSSEAAGTVQELYFDEGMDLRSGDTLLRIDPTRLELELASAEAGRKVAQAKIKAARQEVKRAVVSADYLNKEVARVQQLVAGSSASQRQLDEIEHQYETAQISVAAAEANIATMQAEITHIEANIAQIERQLQDVRPTAPASGTVTEKYIDAGELLGQGRPIVRIAKLDTVWVKIYLPAGLFSKVALGDAAMIDTEAGPTYSGTVTWLTDEAEFTPKNVQTKKARADLVYAVEVTVPNPERRLKVGQPVYVTIGE